VRWGEVEQVGELRWSRWVRLVRRGCLWPSPMAKPSSVNAAPLLFFLLSFSLQPIECSTKLTVCRGGERPAKRETSEEPIRELVERVETI